jgi:hypothetical protein
MENAAARSGVTAEDVRLLAADLPRTETAIVREHLKFRVRGIVYLSVSPDESTLGFAFPKEERADLVATEPDKFLMPATSDLRFNWVCARMSELDLDELREIVLDAWRMVVPKKVVAEHLGG